MALSHRLSRLMRRFGQAQNGTVATIFAVTAIPLCFAMGMGIDIGRNLIATTKLQGALDAAALAAAAADDKSDAARIKIGKDIFAANVEHGILSGSNIVPTITVKNGVVYAVAETKLKTGILQFAGISEMDSAADAEVTIAANKKAEIALVLDYSGSMWDAAGGQQKYVSMRNAAMALVTDLEATSPDKVKFGLVPFSHHVYLNLPGEFVIGAPLTGWTGCTQDRKYPNNLSSSTPSGGDDSKWGQPDAPAHAAWGCVGYVDNNLKVRPLTDDFSAVKSQLSFMKPYAWTHIALGAEFGYHLLSPNAPFAEGANYSDKKTEKYMVVLTDGEQTEPSFGPGGSRNVSNGENNLEKICANAKSDGITLITVAFDLYDPDTVNRLRNCSSDPAKHFFMAKDGADIAEVFKTIKEAITADVFISK
jgi:Flp pilus assembly protein TadG